MRMSKMLGRRIKEDPKDAKTISHKFLVRGGYIRPVSAGIYSMLPLGERIILKIENIIREEMNKIDGQEVKMPVVLPAELWQESGRYDSVGQELLRFRDRNDKPMILGMTHEEAIVHLVRTEIILCAPRSPATSSSRSWPIRSRRNTATRRAPAPG